MNYLKDKNVGLIVGQYKILKLSEKQTEGSRPLYDAVCLTGVWLVFVFKKASVAESADAWDLKSQGGNTVRVQFSPFADFHNINLHEVKVVSSS